MAIQDTQLSTMDHLAKCMDRLNDPKLYQRVAKEVRDTEQKFRHMNTVFYDIEDEVLTFNGQFGRTIFVGMGTWVQLGLHVLSSDDYGNFDGDTLIKVPEIMSKRLGRNKKYLAKCFMSGIPSEWEPYPGTNKTAFVKEDLIDGYVLVEDFPTTGSRAEWVRKFLADTIRYQFSFRKQVYEYLKESDYANTVLDFQDLMDGAVEAIYEDFNNRGWLTSESLKLLKAERNEVEAAKLVLVSLANSKSMTCLSQSLDEILNIEDHVWPLALEEVKEEGITLDFIKSRHVGKVITGFTPGPVTWESRGDDSVILAAILNRVGIKGLLVSGSGVAYSRIPNEVHGFVTIYEDVFNLWHGYTPEMKSLGYATIDTQLKIGVIYPELYEAIIKTLDPNTYQKILDGGGRFRGNVRASVPGIFEESDLA